MGVSCRKELKIVCIASYPFSKTAPVFSLCFPLLMASFSLQTPSWLNILQLLINEYITLIANGHANTSLLYELLGLISCKTPE